MVEKIIDRAITSLRANGVEINREQWIQVLGWSQWPGWTLRVLFWSFLFLDARLEPSFALGLSVEVPVGKNIRWLKHWGVPRAGISDPLGWHYAAWAVECQIYFLENNQLWVEAAAASSRREALSLQWRIYMCFTHVFSGLRDTCLPERSLLEGAVRSQYKYCTCSRQEIFC